ncbi:hypothetical protein [Nostoc sp. PCC 7107]|nr:hypothetical protein [Nostoc sp. PCC 7107]
MSTVNLWKYFNFKSQIPLSVEKNLIKFKFLADLLITLINAIAY